MSYKDRFTELDKGIPLGNNAANHQRAEEDFIVAAETLSKEVEQSNLDEGCIYPSLSKIRSVSYKIACEVARRAYTQGRVRLMDEKGNKIREEDLEAAILKMASYPEPPK